MAADLEGSDDKGEQGIRKTPGFQILDIKTKEYVTY
jgi:hypothetical protein